jgi:hypothetical protein
VFLCSLRTRISQSICNFALYSGGGGGGAAVQQTFSWDDDASATTKTSTNSSSSPVASGGDGDAAASSMPTQRIRVEPRHYGALIGPGGSTLAALQAGAGTLSIFPCICYQSLTLLFFFLHLLINHSLFISSFLTSPFSPGEGVRIDVPKRESNETDVVVSGADAAAGRWCECFCDMNCFFFCVAP